VCALNAWSSLVEFDTLPLSDVLAALPKHKLITLLSSNKEEVMGAVLDVVDKVCSSSDPSITLFMIEDILNAIAKILHEQSIRSILTDCCWITHNFAIGPDIHTEKLISTGILEALCKLVIGKSIDSSVYFLSNKKLDKDRCSTSNSKYNKSIKI
jgi:hypothetical protein